jgi:hypothetical protein
MGRRTRRLVFGALAAGVAGTALAPAAAPAVEYPGPPVSPTVVPGTTTNPAGPTGPTGPAAPAGASAPARAGEGDTEVLGARVTRGSMPFTGGDVAALAAIGVGAAGIGVVLVRRTRTPRTGIDTGS